MNPAHTGHVASADLRGVYAIINGDPMSPDQACARLKALGRGGAAAVQLRAKSADHAHRRDLTVAMARCAAELRIPFVVNDCVELALEDIDGIWGVHLGQEDLEKIHPHDLHAAIASVQRRLKPQGRHVGISTHTLEQVRAVSTLPVTPAYIGFGPIYATASKADASAVTGVRALQEACLRFPGPVVAIGGMNASRAHAIRQAGAQAIAAIAFLDHDDANVCEEQTRRLHDAFQGHSVRTRSNVDTPTEQSRTPSDG